MKIADGILKVVEARVGVIGRSFSFVKGAFNPQIDFLCRVNGELLSFKSTVDMVNRLDGVYSVSAYGSSVIISCIPSYKTFRFLQSEIAYDAIEGTPASKLLINNDAPYIVLGHYNGNRFSAFSDSQVSTKSLEHDRISSFIVNSKVQRHAEWNLYPECLLVGDSGLEYSSNFDAALILEFPNED